MSILRYVIYYDNLNLFKQKSIFNKSRVAKPIKLVCLDNTIYYSHLFILICLSICGHFL